MNARTLTAPGTTRLRNIILVLLLVYAIVIGFLVAGYANVSSCLADYAEKSAVSTNARATIASPARQLDVAERVLSESDRQANRAFSKALSKVLVTLDGTQAAQRAAYADLLAQDAKTAATLDTNEKSREAIRKARAQNEENRKLNPVPPPPSRDC